MARPPWNDRYASGDMPWDTGQPDPLLVAFVESGGIAPGRALEIGAGTGTNAIWLAQHGFDVVGVDLSPLAVEKARAKLPGSSLRCRFAVNDFLAAAPPGGPFDFVFDRAVLHVFDEHEDRCRFAARVAAVLTDGGLWLSLSGSTEGPARDTGPPRRTAREIIGAIEPELELVELRAAEFSSQTETVKGWRCLSRRRAMPAQPSTRR